VHFGTEENVRGPLESLFRHLDLKHLVFGTFGECSTSVKEVLKIAEYGVGHLGRSMAATTLDAVRMVLRSEEVCDSSINGCLEGVRQLNPRQGKVCGYGTLGSKQSSSPGRDAGKG